MPVGQLTQKGTWLPRSCSEFFCTIHTATSDGKWDAREIGGAAWERLT